MKKHYRAVVVGGGVVGVSVLYHLAKFGWRDVALIERSELTAGSTWHAAAGFHALNGDPNIAALQSYTIDLYRQIEAESGVSCGLHMTGGVNVASDPDRWQALKAAWAVFQTMGIDTARLMTPEEANEVCPVADISGLRGGLYDSNEGYLDPHGTTHAYATAARQHGAEVILRNRVLDLRQRPGGGWDVHTEDGVIGADHVVNAAGLWAKQLGLMAGVDLPVTPLEHHYLVTEEIPEVAALDREMGLFVDLDGYTYMRQEGKGMLIGVYELNPKHWQVEGAPWDYGMELIPEDIERISPQLAKGFERYPCLAETGIKRWVNGAFTFTPDGNPLVGPVRGLPGYWVACGVMAGFSQGGGVGKALAEWMIHGEPEQDVYGMDVARYGDYAANREYLRQTTAQFYARRFVMTYPNERLPAGRPLRRPPSYAEMSAAGAQWAAGWGLELPCYFAPADFVETPTLQRSNAFELVGAECRAVRETAGLLDTSGFARYEISGAGAAQWLDRLLACRLPQPGRVRLAPMLGHDGRLKGDLTVINWGPDGSGADRYWLMGSYYLRGFHMRWFEDRLGDGSFGEIKLRDISDRVSGLAIAGPRARELLAACAEGDVSNAALPFMACAELDVGMVRCRVARLSVAGELGFELNCAAGDQATLRDALLAAGQAVLGRSGLREFGFYALNSLRLEKSFGIWSREFTQGYSPAMVGLDRFVAADKGDFIGAAAFAAAGAPAQRLVTLQIDAEDADAAGFEPLYHGGEKVGFITSGGYGYALQQSLALALVDAAAAAPGTELETYIVGEPRRARIIEPSPHDPSGARMRA